MTWWCAASKEPWSWELRAYPGIWLFMALLLAGYLLAWRSAPSSPPSDEGRPQAERGHQADARKKWAFIGGWALLWAATDWPLGTLGAGYLATAHMAQYVLYTMAAAPLLVLGIPEWMLRRALSRLRAYRLVRLLARPIVAAIVFNLVLVATHAPLTVDTFRTNQLGSFALDVAWLASALVLWLPVCGPLEELKPSLPARGVYLFLAAGLVPMVPGGFLTFAEAPLYAVYELAPRVGGFEALDDQQAAGAIMKVGNLPLLWPVLAGLFLKWAAQDRAATPRPARPTKTAPAGQ
jgi:cytochrome c oxidase assembly factor CtaG